MHFCRVFGLFGLAVSIGIPAPVMSAHASDDIIEVDDCHILLLPAKKSVFDTVVGMDRNKLQATLAKYLESKLETLPTSAADRFGEQELLGSLQEKMTVEIDVHAEGYSVDELSQHFVVVLEQPQGWNSAKRVNFDPTIGRYEAEITLYDIYRLSHYEDILRIAPKSIYGLKKKMTRVPPLFEQLVDRHEKYVDFIGKLEQLGEWSAVRGFRNKVTKWQTSIDSNLGNGMIEIDAETGAMRLEFSEGSEMDLLLEVIQNMDNQNVSADTKTTKLSHLLNQAIQITQAQYGDQAFAVNRVPMRPVVEGLPLNDATFSFIRYVIDHLPYFE